MRGELFMAGNCNYRCFFCIRDEIGARFTKSSYRRLDEWIKLLKNEKVSTITVNFLTTKTTNTSLSIEKFSIRRLAAFKQSRKSYTLRHFAGETNTCRYCPNTNTTI